MTSKGDCCPKPIILQAVYFKLRFALSCRDVEELMKMRGVSFDHAAIQRWVYKFAPLLESEMKMRKAIVGKSRRLDETYHKVKGVWCHLYAAVGKLGSTADFLLTRKRQTMSAQCFLIQAENQFNFLYNLHLDRIF